MADPRPPRAPSHAAHFESLQQQVRAAHLGTWIFVGSETLLFAGLFALYATYRTMYPDAFSFGVSHNSRWLGSLNTLILLTSSFTIAAATHALREHRRRLAALLVGATLALAAGFLVVKALEYGQHYEEGIYLDGAGPFLAQHPMRGLSLFFLLYYGMTALHALHVVAGMGVLFILGVLTLRGRLDPPHEHPLHLGAVYWHLVDVIWLFLWPLLYLTGGGGG